MNQPSRLPAAISLSASILSWAVAPVFIRYLSGPYDPYSQAFVRYASGAIALTAISMVWFRRDFLRLLTWSPGLLGVSCLNVFQQCTWTAGTYRSTATAAQLTVTLHGVFVIIASYILFHEERRVIRSPLYLVGTAVSFLGVTAVLAKDPASMLPVLDAGAAFLLTTAVFWGIYKVWSKHLVMGMHPIPMFAVIAVYTSLGLLGVSLTLGRPETIISAGARISVIAFISGLFPIALAHPAYNYAQKHLGAAFSSNFNLLVPLFTYLFGMLVLEDEYLTQVQWLGAALLLGGVAMVTTAGNRAQAPSPKAAPRPD